MRRATFQVQPLVERQLSLGSPARVFQSHHRMPLSIWFLAIYFLSQTKSESSAATVNWGCKLGGQRQHRLACSST